MHSDRCASTEDDRWHVVPHGKAAAALFRQRNLTVVAAAFTGGRECYICLCADGSVISLGCACRGAAGSAHLGCAVEAAVHAEEQCQQQTGMLSWCTCALCHQDYTGPMQMGLAKEGVRRVQHLLERDEKRLFANNNLAAALLRKGNYAQAEVLFANIKLLAIAGDNNPEIAHDLANCLTQQCKYEEAVTLERHNLQINRRVHGVEHRSTLDAKQALATALQHNDQLEEAETVFRTTLSTMKRVLPKNAGFTLVAMNGLANMLRALEKHAEAEDMFRDLVGIT